MIYVLEGTKCSGKTTFANALKEVCSVPVFHFYNRDLLKFDLKQDDANFASCLSYVKAAIEIEKTMNGACIILFDRLHLSEMVYGRYARGYTNDRMWIVDNILAANGAKGILFVSDTAENRSGKKEYKEEFVKMAEQSSMKWKMMNLDGLNGKFTTRVILEGLW